jgi:hypothetical protein
LLLSNQRIRIKKRRNRRSRKDRKSSLRIRNRLKSQKIKQEMVESLKPDNKKGKDFSGLFQASS